MATALRGKAGKRCWTHTSLNAGQLPSAPPPRLSDIGTIHNQHACDPVGEKKGRVFQQLQLEQIVRIRIEAFSIGLHNGEGSSRRSGSFKRCRQLTAGDEALCHSVVA